MTLTQRATALAVYRSWFYAPHITGRRACERLIALGFQWHAARWVMPDVDTFVQRMRNQ